MSCLKLFAPSNDKANATFLFGHDYVIVYWQRRTPLVSPDLVYLVPSRLAPTPHVVHVGINDLRHYFGCALVSKQETSEKQV